MAKNKQYTTPKGTFVFPRLNTPDFKFEKCGIYKVKLELDPDKAKTFKKLLDAAVFARVKEGQEAWADL